ncbi:MAG TPA: transglutaminase-like domain-containing protein [Bryobacteraceae bacterium]|nr:transglutaminase-like domain-containing protein [Bryobacteraceae bacterium]
MNHLRQLLETEEVQPGRSQEGRLDRAALDLATIQFPDLEPEPFLDQLNELASRLADRMRNFNDGRDFVETAQRYLFGELGFHGVEGGEDNFFDARNSCLNQVLERRTGIPITLSVMYMEIARRLRMPVYGIGLPRHFVLQFDDGNYSTFIDPFHGGRTITARDCFILAEARIADLALLQRVSNKQIAMRMVQNLHRVYLRARDYKRAVATLDLMIAGAPETAPWYKFRGALLVETHRWQAARRDFEKYLAMEPGAEDREEILDHIRSIQRLIAQVN